MEGERTIVFIFGVYMLIMILIGEICARYKIKSLKDYILAGGRQGVLVTSGSLSATVLGAGSTIGAAGVAYYIGISAVWYILSAIIALLLLAFTFAPAIKNLSLYTIPEFMERRYGKTSRMISALLGLLGLTLFLSAQFYALGITASTLLNLPQEISIIIFGLIVTIYTWRGGNWGVQLTDNFQYIVILVGILSMIFFLFKSIQFSAFESPPFVMGFEELGNNWFNPLNKRVVNGWNIFSLGNTVFAWIIMSVTWHFAMQSTAQRILSSRDPKTAKISCLLSSLLLLPISFGIGIAGMAARFLLHPLNWTGDISQTQALPLLVKSILPPTLSGLMISALVAVIMSTCDSVLLGASTIFTKDIYQRFIKSNVQEKELMNLSKGATFITGLLGLTGSLLFMRLVQLLEIVAGIYCVSLFVPIILGLYWKKPKESGAIIAMIGSFLTGLFWRFSGWEKISGIHMLNLCFPISLLSMLFVTFIDKNIMRKVFSLFSSR